MYMWNASHSRHVTRPKSVGEPGRALYGVASVSVHVYDRAAVELLDRVPGTGAVSISFRRRPRFYEPFSTRAAPHCAAVVATHSPPTSLGGRGGPRRWSFTLRARISLPQVSHPSLSLNPPAPTPACQVLTSLPLSRTYTLYFSVSRTRRRWSLLRLYIYIYIYMCMYAYICIYLCTTTCRMDARARRVLRTRQRCV